MVGGLLALVGRRFLVTHSCRGDFLRRNHSIYSIEGLGTSLIRSRCLLRRRTSSVAGSDTLIRLQLLSGLRHVRYKARYIEDPELESDLKSLTIFLSGFPGDVSCNLKSPELANYYKLLFCNNKAFKSSFMLSHYSN